jgi:hypothetical protein
MMNVYSAGAAVAALGIAALWAGLPSVAGVAAILACGIAGYAILAALWR